MENKPARLCELHGGDVADDNAYWLCDECSRSEISKCICGSHARYFGEALMCSVSCELCSEFVMTVGDSPDIRELWNDGFRGSLEYSKIDPKYIIQWNDGPPGFSLLSSNHRKINPALHDLQLKIFTGSVFISREDIIDDDIPKPRSWWSWIKSFFNGGNVINITMTGLDEIDTKGYKNAVLRNQFDHHESGILYSETKSGVPRYPSPEIIDKLLDLPKTALHICGRAVRQLALKGEVSKVLSKLINKAGRVQINISSLDWTPKNLAENLRSINPETNWIIQFGMENNQVQRCQDLITHFHKIPYFLFDRSGGRGILDDEWPEIELPNMGAAGGLTSDNLMQQLRRMRDSGYIRFNFWVDTESGIRTDDKWDWTKARDFLLQTQQYLQSKV